MWRGRSRFSYLGPRVQLRIRVVEIRVLTAPNIIEAAPVRCLRLLSSIASSEQPSLSQVVSLRSLTVDHVLKFVSQNAIVEGVTHIGSTIHVDVEHLHFVGVLADGTYVGVCTGEVPGDGAPEVAGMKDAKVWVTVDAGRPLGAEELTVSGVGVLLKEIRCLHDVTLSHVQAFLDPHVHVLGLVDQPGLKLEGFVGIEIRRCEGPNRANGSQAGFDATRGVSAGTPRKRTASSWRSESGFRPLAASAASLRLHRGRGRCWRLQGRRCGYDRIIRPLNKRSGAGLTGLGSRKHEPTCRTTETHGAQSQQDKEYAPSDNCESQPT